MTKTIKDQKTYNDLMSIITFEQFLLNPFRHSIFVSITLRNEYFIHLFK